MNEHEKNTEVTSPEVSSEPVESVTESVTDIAPTEASTDAPSSASSEIIAPVAPTTEDATETEKTEATPEDKKASPVVMVTAGLSKAMSWVCGRKYTISAVALVLIALVGLLYIMEEQGRIETGVFDKVGQVLGGRTAVAVVNGEKITRAELDTSVSQIAAGAAAQGMDTTDPELSAQIRSQAVDMLVNTELLMQEAEVRNVQVTDEDVEERISTLREDIGGEEVLNERMKEFGIDEKTLRRDVKNELTIKALLDTVFAEKGIEITDAEVAEFYASAGGAEAGLPALEEVAEQIKAQIRSTKEQEQVTTLIEELRGKANIELR